MSYDAACVIAGMQPIYILTGVRRSLYSCPTEKGPTISSNAVSEWQRRWDQADTKDGQIVSFVTLMDNLMDGFYMKYQLVYNSTKRQNMTKNI